MNKKSRSPYDIEVKCCRCKFIHWESDREMKAEKKKVGSIQVWTRVCPKCSCTTYYKVNK